MQAHASPHQFSSGLHYRQCGYLTQIAHLLCARNIKNQETGRGGGRLRCILQYINLCRVNRGDISKYIDFPEILIRTPDIVSPSSSLYNFWESPHHEPLLVSEMINVICPSNVLGINDFKGVEYISTNYYSTVDWFKLKFDWVIFHRESSWEGNR